MYVHKLQLLNSGDMLAELNSYTGTGGYYLSEKKFKAVAASGDLPNSHFPFSVIHT